MPFMTARETEHLRQAVPIEDWPLDFLQEHFPGKFEGRPGPGGAVVVQRVNTDRLALSYTISTLARDIEARAQHLTVAECLYESDLSDHDLRVVADGMVAVQRKMDFDDPRV